MTTNTKQPKDNATEVEWIKHRSNFLRGTIADDLKNEATGSIQQDNTQLIKFHGIYQQDDRDLRKQRIAAKLENDYSFMIRLRLPGGDLKAEQMQILVQLGLASESASLKLTTRQAIQLHGILKHNLRDTITSFHQKMLDSIAACGDVNRNVMCSPAPSYNQELNKQIFAYAAKVSERLLPASKAWYELWLNDEKIEYKKPEKEPIYGNHYLPRKFKIAIAIPPTNDVDVYSQDIGIIAVVEKGMLQGFNIFVGGGLATSHGDPETKALLAQPFGFCPAEKLLSICEAILVVQRDYGNRENRRQSRTKYTLRKLGKEKFIRLVQEKANFTFEPIRAYKFTGTDDKYGWQHSGKHWHRVLCVENGRLKDAGETRWLTALLQLAEKKLCQFRITPNQNIMLYSELDTRQQIDSILSSNGIEQQQNSLSTIRKLAIACTALSTCSLAMAEAERYLPYLLKKIQALLEKHKLEATPIIIRMTGCPNGCARSRLSEIGFVGKALGRYQLFLGASPRGDRLNSLYKDNLKEEEILKELDQLFKQFAANRKEKEFFGDFCQRIIFTAESNKND